MNDCFTVIKVGPGEIILSPQSQGPIKTWRRPRVRTLHQLCMISLVPSAGESSPKKKVILNCRIETAVEIVVPYARADWLTAACHSKFGNKSISRVRARAQAF